MHFQSERGARRVMGSAESITNSSAVVTRKQLGKAFGVAPKAWM